MKRIVIGITGSFGSGKTTVARMFQKIINRNVKIIDADKIARDLMKTNEIKTEIKKEFGTTDRKKLAAIVFSDKNKLAKINKIVHPSVIEKVRNGIRNQKIIVVDIPLLFEAGMQNIFDVIIVVKCKKNIQIKRLMKKGFKRDEIIKRIKSQMPMVDKMRHAGYIIDNTGDLADTKEQIAEIWDKLKGLKI